MYKNFIKDLLDFLLALTGLLILSPIVIVITLLLLVSNNGSAFFLQARPGKNGKPFKIVKFKTMSNFKVGGLNDINDVSRITKFGAFLRKYSLDEILQLVNVLKGDMSIIGPRPLLMEYLPLYNDFQSKRHQVKPGITGWAQVNGRNAISWDQKFEYDVWYVNNVSFELDVKIVFMTIKKVIKKENVNKSENTIMTVWSGNNT